jgi:nucleoside-diphosphate-sugar epimerase
MRFNRRALVFTAGAAALASAAAPLFAKSKPKKVLILGGTGFIGPHFVKALMDGGHTITLFNRGKRDPEAHPGVEQLLGDRDGKLEALANRSWDVVIDNSGYYPRVVRQSAELLKPRVPHYVFISSVAVYRDFATPGADENYPRGQLEAGAKEEFSGATYGPFKAACEDVIGEIYGKHATFIRPTYIAGPGDHTDRFTYWPFRFSQGGEMLAPGTPADPMEYIDVRDVANFVRVCVETRATGPFNLIVPPGSTTFGKVLDTSRQVTGADTKVTWAPVDFLRAQGMISNYLERGSPLPLWTPPGAESAGYGLSRSGRAVAKGLTFHPLEQTIRDTLEWQKTRPAENQTLKAGLTPAREAELLKQIHGT